MRLGIFHLWSSEALPANERWNYENIFPFSLELDQFISGAESLIWYEGCHWCQAVRSPRHGMLGCSIRNRILGTRCYLHKICHIVWSLNQGWIKCFNWINIWHLLVFVCLYLFILRDVLTIDNVGECGSWWEHRCEAGRDTDNMLEPETWEHRSRSRSSLVWSYESCGQERVLFPES